MVVSFGIGAGFGVVAGLLRMGEAPPEMTLDVVLSALKVGAFFLVVAWLAVAVIRFARLLRP